MKKKYRTIKDIAAEVTEQKDSMVSLRLSSKLLKKLDALAVKGNLSRSKLIVEILKDFIEVNS